jgi:type IV secretory pathway VirB10-like protein
MEQRALIASLVLGCVTAAGAGGYMAVRQMAPAQAAAPVMPVTPAPDPTEGTVADLGAVPEPSAVQASDNLVAPAPAPAQRASADRAVPTSTQRPTPPAQARASAQTPAPPARVESRPTPPAPAPAPAAAPAPAPAREEAPRDTWPAPAAGTQAQAPDTTRPADAWNGSFGGSSSRDTASADASAPSRQAPAEPVEPQAPQRRMEDVTIPRDAVIGVQLETSASSDRSRVEDVVRARVTRDVLANGTVVVPAGSRLLGSVTLVEEGGRIKERARLGVKFHTLVLADGTEVRLPTEVIYREGDEVAGRAAAKIGGAAIGGAILGAIMGGGKGAVIGATTGAGSGTGWAMAGDRKPAELRAGQSVTVRVSDSVTTQIVR